MASFFCSQPICGRVDVEVRDLQLTDIDMHGSILANLFPQGLLESGVKDRVESELEPLRKRWECADDCACTSVNVAEFDVSHSRRLTNEVVVPAASVSKTFWGVPVGIGFGGIAFSATLTFTMHINVWAGICHSTNPAALADNAKALQRALEELRKMGERIRAGMNPDDLWKEIGGASPKALRESPSVEPPVRIRRRKLEETPGD